MGAQSALERLLGSIEDDELIQLLMGCNDPYLARDELDALDLPSGIHSDDLWRLLCIARGATYQSLPINAHDGRELVFTRTARISTAIRAFDRIGFGVASHGLEAIYGANGSIATAALKDPGTVWRTSTNWTQYVVRSSVQQPDEASLFGEPILRLTTNMSSMAALPLTPETIVGICEELGRPVRESLGRFVEAAMSEHNGEQFQTRLTALCDVAERDIDHPLIRAAVVFWQLNGLKPEELQALPVEGIVAQLVLTRCGYRFAPLLALQNLLARALETSADTIHWHNGALFDVTRMLETLTAAAATSATRLADRADHIRARLDELDHLIANDPTLNLRQAAILRHQVRSHVGELTIEEVARIQSTSYGTARSDLLGLAHMGYLAHEREGRTFVFTAGPRLMDRPAAVVS